MIYTPPIGSLEQCCFLQVVQVDPKDGVDGPSCGGNISCRTVGQAVVLAGVNGTIIVRSGSVLEEAEVTVTKPVWITGQGVVWRCLPAQRALKFDDAGFGGVSGIRFERCSSLFGGAVLVFLTNFVLRECEFYHCRASPPSFAMSFAGGGAIFFNQVVREACSTFRCRLC